MTVPISHLAELNIEFLFFTMMSNEHLDAFSSDIAQSNLQQFYKQLQQWVLTERKILCLSDESLALQARIIMAGHQSNYLL